MPWLTNWNYRKMVTISNTGSALSDYQFTVYSYHIDMKIVEKYMKETEDIVKHLTDDDKWLAYNLLGLMYFKDFIKNFAKHYTN